MPTTRRDSGYRGGYSNHELPLVPGVCDKDGGNSKARIGGTGKGGEAVSEWQKMEDAPRDGTAIVGLYDDGEAVIMWSDRPHCMLGVRQGGFPPGWAADGSETDRNLPMGTPKAWRPCEPAKEVKP